MHYSSTVFCENHDFEKIGILIHLTVASSMYFRVPYAIFQSGLIAFIHAHSFATIFTSSTTRFVTERVHHRRFSRDLGACGSCLSLPTTYCILHNGVGSQPDALVCATTVGIALHSTIRNCWIPCLHYRCIVGSDNEDKVDTLWKHRMCLFRHSSIGRFVYFAIVLPRVILRTPRSVSRVRLVNFRGRFVSPSSRGSASYSICSCNIKMVCMQDAWFYVPSSLCVLLIPTGCSPLLYAPGLEATCFTVLPYNMLHVIIETIGFTFCLACPRDLGDPKGINT